MHFLLIILPLKKAVKLGLQGLDLQAINLNRLRAKDLNLLAFSSSRTHNFITNVDLSF